MKTQIVLELFDELSKGEVIKRATFCEEHFITKRTFYRYVREIEIYLERRVPNKKVFVKEGVGEYTFEYK